MPDYVLCMRTPTVDEYRRLRSQAGLSQRSVEASEAGLPNTIAGVVVDLRGRAVGMGRIVGDGGLFFQVVDIAVAPAHQGQGLGKRIMDRLMAELREHVPAEAYVSLIADGQANRLYAQFGFEPTAPESIGMAVWLNRSANSG